MTTASQTTNPHAPVPPPEVQRQIDRANQLVEEIKAQKAAAAPPPMDTEVPPTVPAPASATPTPDAPQPAASGPGPQTAPIDAWEHKYQVLQGKYSSEVPRLASEVRTLREQLNSAKAELKAAQDAAMLRPANRLITPEEEEAYGEELLNVVGRRAKEMYDPIISAMQQKIDQLEGQVRTVDTVTARSRLVDSLARSVPQYKEINRDPRFLAWLDQIDPYAGEVRGVMLRQAYDDNDSARVVAFFDGFLREHATQTPAGLPTPETPNLMDRVAPGSAAHSRPSGEMGAQAKRIWTPDMIGRFYSDVNRGKFRGREAEQRRIEEEIVASTSGRANSNRY